MMKRIRFFLLAGFLSAIFTIITPGTAFSQMSPRVDQVRVFVMGIINASLLDPSQQPDTLRSLIKQNENLIHDVLSGELQRDLQNSDLASWLSAVDNMELPAPQNIVIRTLFKLKLFLFGLSISDKDALTLFQTLDQQLTDVDPTKTPVFAILEQKLAAIPGASEHVGLIKASLPSYYKSLPLETKKKQLLGFLKIAGEAGKDADAKYLGVIFQQSGTIVQRITQNIYANLPEGDLKKSIKANLSQVPAEPKEVAMQTLEDDLGPPSQYFSVIDDSNRGGALGQLHHSVLINGQEAGIKVQRSDLEAKLAAEYETFKVPLKGTPFEKLAQRYYESILAELDGKENTNIDISFQQYGYKNPRVKVVERIKSVPNTKHVVVMKWIKGDSLDNVLEDMSKLSNHQLEEIGKGLMAWYELWLETALFKSGWLLADSHPGNIMVDLSTKSNFIPITIVDIGNFVKLTPETQKMMITLIAGAGAQAPELIAESVKSLFRVSESQETITALVAKHLNADIPQDKMLVKLGEELLDLHLDPDMTILSFVRSINLIATQIRSIDQKLGSNVLNVNQVYKNLALRYAFSSPVLSVLLKPKNVASIAQTLPKRISEFKKQCDLAYKGLLQYTKP